MGDALAGLELLLNAPDKETVLSLMDDAFACRDEGWTQDRRRRVAQDLSLASDTDDGQQQVTALYASAVHLIRAALYNNPQSAEDMVALFSDGFHPKLKGGEGRGRESPQHRKWRERAVSAPFVTAPRLTEFDWVVHTPSSSAAAATATISLKVQQPQTSAAVEPGIERVALEVDRETLGEMVATFGGIRDQVAVMTNK